MSFDAISWRFLSVLNLSTYISTSLETCFMTALSPSFSRKFLPFLLTLALVACCIEIDISVPSFPGMANHFKVSDGVIQLTIAYNFLGFCLASFFYGPLSDCYGRRKVMIYGNALLVLGAVGCVFAPSIPFLLVSRFIQGIGASTSAVVVFAMAADAYQGEKAVKLIAFMNSLLTTLMAIAPVFGAFITEAVGWRGNYSAVAIVCVVSWALLYFFLPETKDDLETFSLRKVLKDYGTILSSRKFMVASLVPSLLCGSYMAFVATASCLYIESFGLSTTAYALHQGAFVGSFSVISLFSGKVAAAFGAKESVQKALLLSIAGTTALVGLSFVAPNSPYLITSLMVVFGTGVAVIYPIVFASSLEVFPEIKGTASSAIMAMRAFLCSGAVFAVSSVYNGQTLPIAMTILAFTLLGAVCTIQWLKTCSENELPLEVSSSEAA